MRKNVNRADGNKQVSARRRDVFAKNRVVRACKI